MKKLFLLVLLSGLALAQIPVTAMGFDNSVRLPYGTFQLGTKACADVYASGLQGSQYTTEASEPFCYFTKSAGENAVYQIALNMRAADYALTIERVIEQPGNTRLAQVYQREGEQTGVLFLFAFENGTSVLVVTNIDPTN